MLHFFRKKGIRSLGIDLQMSSVNVVEVSYFQGIYWIEKQGSQVLPAGLWRDETKDHSERLSALIQQVLQQLNIKNRSACIAIPDRLIQRKDISISSKLSMREIEALISCQLSKMTNSRDFTDSQQYFDFHLLGDEQPMMTASIYFISKSLVNFRLQVLNRIGFQVRAIDMESLAINRALNYLGRDILKRQVDDRCSLQVAQPQGGLQQRITVENPLIRRVAALYPRVRGEGNHEGGFLEELPDSLMLACGLALTPRGRDDVTH